MGITINDTLNNTLTTNVANCYAMVCPSTILMSRSGTTITVSAGYRIYENQAARNADINSNFKIGSLNINFDISVIGTVYDLLYTELKTNFTSTVDV